MIVNPQLFNYRLIIGSLVIAIVVLGSFSYSSYEKVKQNQVFVQQESKLVESELSEMISQYEKVEVENDNLKYQFEKTKNRMKSILDSVKLLKPSGALISKYKSEIRILKLENEKVLNLVENLETENTQLKAKTKKIETVLQKEKSIVDAIKTEHKVLSKSYVSLKEDLETAKQLSIANLEAEAVKRVTSKRIVDTRHANKAKQIHVCFTLTSNKFADSGEKEIYIQILDNKMNVVANKGFVDYGKRSLIYSFKKTVNYNKEDINVCSLIEKDIDVKLEKGLYFINVFHDGETLGKTTIELK
ncbi:hypothetical protein [uncultured Lacinutrix sp.]|uniref:hypothetical protein n=1 Tax=uncultured Lacinutrix sp. TaxID=574032 RepID=UPI002611BE4B|nr:hypothetical protein [uncultured Lacinutrix sp.]